MLDMRLHSPKSHLAIARSLVKKIQDAGGHVEAVYYEGESCLDILVVRSRSSFFSSQVKATASGRQVAGERPCSSLC